MNKDKLIEDNMKLVYYVINKYYPSYLGDEDVVQEGMLGLCRAANNYDPSKTKFSTYAVICIKHQILYYLRSRSKHNGTLSLDYDVKGEERNCEPFVNFIVGELDVDTVWVDFKTFYSTLTENEKNIIDLSLYYSPTEIGEMLGKTMHNVHSTKSKIKRKWRKFLEKN